MIQVRRARPEDAGAIGAIHRLAWQDAYPGLLPQAYLARLDERRLATGYRHSMVSRRAGEAIFVACPAEGAAPVGFASAAPARRAGIAEGEIETLYLLPDWREQGVGRRLMRASAAHLSAIGCHSAMLWVLSANGAGWFYRHLGGRPVGRETIRVGGGPVEQTAMLWNPIDLLLDATAATREGDAQGEG